MHSQFLSQFGITPCSGNLYNLYFEPNNFPVSFFTIWILPLASPSQSPCSAYVTLSLFSPFFLCLRVWFFLYGISAAATECFFYLRDLELQSPLMLLPYCTSTLLWLLLMTFFVSLSLCFASSSPPPLVWMEDLSYVAIKGECKAVKAAVSSFPSSSSPSPSQPLRCLKPLLYVCVHVWETAYIRLWLKNAYAYVCKCQHVLEDEGHFLCTFAVVCMLSARVQ